MAILGSNSPGGLYRSLKEGNNGDHNVLLKVTPSSDLVVSSFIFYGGASNSAYWNNAWGYIGTLSGFTLNVIKNVGNVGSVSTIPSWRTFAISPSITLTANTTYCFGIQGSSVAYPMFIAYQASTTTYNTHGYSGYWAVDEPNRLYSMYVEGEYIQTGPPITISGKTPGKLEHTSWANIKSVR